MKTVSWYEKGKPLQYRNFSTFAEAQAFCLALNANPNVEAYKIERAQGGKQP